MNLLQIAEEIFKKIVPLKTNRIVFMSYNGRYSDSPKCISEKMHELNDKLELVWLVEKKYKDRLPDYVKYIEYDSLKALYYYASAHIIVDNVFGNKSFNLYKSSNWARFKNNLLKFLRTKKRQYVYTTWHGTPIKKIGMDEIGNKIYDFNCPNTYMLIDNNYLGNIMNRINFGKINNILIGSPRNDILYTSDLNYINDTKEKLGISRDKKVLFYAPTFRTDGGMTCKNIERSGINQIESIDFNSLFDVLNKKFGGDWVFVCRFHYHVDNMVNWEKIKEDFGDKIINGNKDDDISKYLLCADVLLSDLSSCMYDFSITKKPIFSYFPDYDYYESKERGLYISMPETPFGCAKTFDELIQNINNFDSKQYVNNIEKMRKEMGYIEVTNATEEIAKYILKERNIL